MFSVKFKIIEQNLASYNDGGRAVVESIDDVICQINYFNRLKKSGFAEVCDISHDDGSFGFTVIITTTLQVYVIFFGYSNSALRF